MKKKFLLGWALAALFVLAGASVWEGAAAVSLNGELPEEGYYAAANSFPRDSSVIVTNLETGKSVRVTIVSTLDNPGLLTVLSPKAAAEIGLHARYIGRVRMIHLAEPLAFSRYPEETNMNGGPDGDSPAVTSAGAASDPEAIMMEVFPSPVLSGPATDINDASGDDSPAVTSAGADNDLEAIAMEVFPSPVLSDLDPGVFSPPSEPEKVQGEEKNIAPTPDLAWTYQEGGELAPNIPAETLPVFAGENREKDIVLSEEPQKSLREEEDRAYVQDAPAQPIPEDYEMVLIPAEQRPPAEAVSDHLPPEAEIPPLPDRRGAQTALERKPDPAYFVDPISPPAPSPAQPVQQETPAPAKTAPAVSNTAPPVSNPPSSTAPVPSRGTEPAAPSFSVPLISSLERGKYYLQLGAYSKTERVESEVSKIGKTYPLTIQTGGSSESPLYRILLGPVNLGESNALLERFRRLGYTDAFVRNGGM
ncbi:MAG: SPOR domain-containing protein [Treponema sp.]|jgi:cell division septation protein DedD|nr:SPOR domain-containing protein [Treponema sp.]